MALVESIDIPLGTSMPSFKLSDPDGKSYSSQSLLGKQGLLVVFTCNHCPYAIPQWPRLISLAVFAKPLGVNTVAINPNIHPNYPDDSPEQMKIKIKEWKIPFPYLVDDSQTVARAFKAQCTPDPYLFDEHGKLLYHGRIDDNWKDTAKVTRQELKEAIQCLANDEVIDQLQHPSIGCSIKWR